VAIAGFFINYVTESRPNTDNPLGARFLAGAQGAFAIGRFAGTFLMRLFRPRWVFLAFMTCCIIFISPAIAHGGNAGMAMLYLTLFFESIIFPTIVALGMRGLGRHTKRGSGYIVAGVAGGAVVPPLLGVAADNFDSTQKAMCVPLAFFIAAWSYSLCVNFVPAYRDVADRFSTTDIGVTKNEGTDLEKSGSIGVQSESGKRSESTAYAPDINDKVSSA
jgi:FHS family L-fucose permease-like MFS transporter